jgi:8-oxo-dGTP pyrophosphatase MutT (NUDIX family)
MSERPLRQRVACGGIVLCNGHGLLIRKHGLWDLPKGKRRRGESVKDCAVREISEETGLAASLLKPRSMLCKTRYVAYYGGEPVLKKVRWLVLAYEGDTTDPLAPDIAEDIDLCRWVPFAELDEHFKGARPYLQPVARAVLDFLVEVSN